MRSIITHQHKPLERGFKWRDGEGNYWSPSEMETRHLFFTLRMIWNHSAPPEYRITPYQPYRFSGFYTPEYLAKAVKEIMQELRTRDDLEPYYLRCLRYMDAVVNEEPTL